MTDRRVVITGAGVLSAVGIGREQHFQSMLDGIIGIDRIRAFDPGGFPSQIAGEVSELTMKDIVPRAYRKATKLMSRDIQLAVAAADFALRDAGLNTKGTHPDGPIDIDPARTGVNIGAGLICCDLIELSSAASHAIEDGKFSLRKWGVEGMNELTPLWLLKYLPNMLSCHITIIHDLQGPSNSITNAEVSGLMAIGEAYRYIVRGKADVMIAGGAESKVNPMTLLRQCLIKRVSTSYNDKPKEASRPFDRDADGTVIGEGGAIVVLEELECARRRGATIYAELTGFGASYNFSDDFVEPEPQGTGIAIALQKAMQQARLAPGQIQLLIPHGVAVPSHDRAEANAAKTVFGSCLKDVHILATKSRIGNCGAASGAIDMVTAVLALSEGRIPANMNCPNPVENELKITNTNSIDADIDHAMVSCYTYGGQTAALAISKMK
jgi:3-oxoacyl-[acyl-carrier-protein] synthase II